MAQGIVVHKYGGSSVADVDKIRRVAELIAARRAEGFGLVVVVSAMGDTTDELLALAKRVTPNPHRRELDMLLTAGERISMALLSMALIDRGTPAISFTGSQSGIITTDDHARARIVDVRPGRVKAELEAGKVVIIAGYQGVSEKREVTTLGRGGSDTSAVAMAAALDAVACEIYSDVDGVYSADPRVVPAAARIPRLSHAEMQALAHAGAQVLNAQAVEFARSKGITIHAKRTFGGGEGTRVGEAQGAPAVVAIAQDDALALLCAAPDVDASRLATFLQGHGVHRRPARLDRAGTALILPTADLHDGTFEHALRGAFAGKVTLATDVAAVSAVGRGAASAARDLEEAARRCGCERLATVEGPLQLGVVVARSSATALTRALHARLLEGATS
jgi:aspartate kinase